MLTLKAAGYGAAASIVSTLLGTVLHYSAHGYVAAESYVFEKAQSTYNEYFNKVAEAQGFIKYTPELNITELAEAKAKKFGVNPCLIKAIAKHESNNCKNQISQTNDYGCLQINTRSAKEICGISDPVLLLTDKELNFDCGVKILKTKIDQFGAWEGIRRYNGFSAARSNVEYRDNIVKNLLECVG